MGWYYKCPFCQSEGKYVRMSCDCQEYEDDRIMQIIKGGEVIDTFVSYEKVMTDQYTHILKDGVNHYVCYSSGSDYSVAGFSEVLQFEFADKKREVEADKKERALFRVLEGEVEDLAQDLYQAFLANEPQKVARVSVSYHGYKFQGRFRNYPFRGDNAQSMRVCLMIYDQSDNECTRFVLQQSGVPTFDIDDCHLDQIIPILKWMKSLDK